MEQTKLGRFWDRAREAFSSPYARKAILNTVSFLGGMLCSRGLVFGKFAPFGVAAVASVPREGLWAAALGAFLGYLLPSPAAAFLGELSLTGALRPVAGVLPMAMAAAAAGADGIMIEVHNDPPHALCDGAQSLTPEQFAQTARKIFRIREAMQE